MMDRKTWSDCIAEALRRLGDYHYQVRVWIRVVGPESSSWGEAICNLCDDCDLPGFLSRDDVARDSALSTALRHLEELFGTDPHSPAANTIEQLDSKQWQDIRAAATHALAELTRWEAQFGD